jgi:hypothetical protein
LCLPYQAVAQALSLRVVADIAQAKALDSDRAADCGIESAVNDAHGAAAKLLHDLVATYLLHGSPCMFSHGRHWAARKPISPLKASFDAA